jgi:hypothetical protein
VVDPTEPTPMITILVLFETGAIKILMNKKSGLILSQYAIHTKGTFSAKTIMI